MLAHGHTAPARSHLGTLGRPLMTVPPTKVHFVYKSRWPPFSDQPVSPTLADYGTCANGGGTNGWFCEHRWPVIAGLVAFRDKVFSSDVDSYVGYSSQQIACGRSRLELIIINNADATWSRTFSTSLPGGEYCNYTADAPSGGTLAGAW